MHPLLREETPDIPGRLNPEIETVLATVSQQLRRGTSNAATFDSLRLPLGMACERVERLRVPREKFFARLEEVLSILPDDQGDPELAMRIRSFVENWFSPLRTSSTWRIKIK